jgi:hypothetical protein
MRGAAWQFPLMASGNTAESYPYPYTTRHQHGQGYQYADAHTYLHHLHQIIMYIALPRRSGAHGCRTPALGAVTAMDVFFN